MMFTPGLSQSDSLLSLPIPPTPCLPSSRPLIRTSAANNTSDDRESKDEVVGVCRRSCQHMVTECVCDADVGVENEVPRVSD